jgi:hypothetical protein
MTEIFSKNILHASIQFHFLYLYFVSENLVPQYEQLLSLTIVGALSLR